MVSHSFRLYCYSAALVVTGCILTAAIPIHHVFGPFNSLIIGYAFGTMFGQGTLAAAWAALGPSPRVWRMPLSLVWMLLIVAAVPLHLRGDTLDELKKILLIFAICLIAQWLVVQFAVWMLDRTFGWRLRHTSDVESVVRPLSRQFGIRRLMIVTALVGVAFGIGRVVMPSLAQNKMLSGLLIFGFFAVFVSITHLPLLLAVIRQRFAVRTSLLILLLICLVTPAEAALVNATRAGSCSTRDFALINGYAAFWILAVGGVIRRVGYRFGTPTAPSAKQSDQAPTAAFSA